MSSFTDLPTEIDNLFNSHAKETGANKLLASLLEACKTIGTNIRNCSYSSETVGTTNDFGDHQLDVDVKTDEVIFDALRRSGLVHTASSEESPSEVECGGVGFSVAFDPLDGSSIVGTNFAVGTIVGVWPGKGLLQRYGREQSFSLVAQYGPRITVALAINKPFSQQDEPISLELTLQRSVWVVTKSKLVVKHSGKTFAPGNLRATSDNPRYKSLVDFWIENKYTLRYSGGLVPDVYHILLKGEGVLSNASSPSAKAKLRLLYECAPIALIIESAGGSSCVCASEAAEAVDPISLLDVCVSDLDKRVGVCYGSRDEVERFKEYIFKQ